jgi:hypothetical protein
LLVVLAWRILKPLVRITDFADRHDHTSQLPELPAQLLYVNVNRSFGDTRPDARVDQLGARYCSPGRLPKRLENSVLSSS